MRHVKWIFVVLLISSLTSFITKDKPTGGLNVGDIAPDFESLRKLKGNYVLLSFWASYDAQSRLHNTLLNNAIQNVPEVKMVSISFDEYQSIFKETIRKDQIVEALCLVETKGEKSNLYKKYNLDRGFSNYLLDEKGIIIAKNISAAELPGYMN
ncbi:hypothetical protein LJC72_03650 [Bacteroides sp. OttesenSCG-928-D19]|nr:hypothetical protein [Bacteroides sp. OttesenSCG-928-D19]